MQKPLVYTATIFTVTLLAGCASSTDGGSKLVSFPGAYKIDIQQGNVITQEMVNQLRPGMTRSQVQYVMGTPLLDDIFNQDRWDYVYSLQPGNEPRTQKTVSIFFDDNRLSSIQGDLRPKSTEKTTP
ncbi:outer membrane protein assembly factor BamE [Candidatus Sororendozoicomonas aggregata]|uniref:outer membrane protein assembly factor BamE n=1 Tax=Candidatus Sororendozoicomonas aggregata TaxID=3073239 RepID=UPI002ED1CA8A